MLLSGWEHYSAGSWKASESRDWQQLETLNSLEADTK